MNQKGLCLGVLMGISLLMLGCGKVTQVSQATDENKTFDIVVKMPVAVTDNATVMQPLTQGLVSDHSPTVKESPFYVRVVGITKDNTLDELAWGKATLSVVSASIQANRRVVKRKSTSYRKDGNELNTAEYLWAKLTYDDSKATWVGDCKKIKRGYPFYLVMVYAGKSKFWIQQLDAKTVSDNKTVMAGDFNSYDSVVLSVVLKSLPKNKSISYDKQRGDVAKVMTAQVFAALGGAKKSAGAWDPSAPVFDWQEGLSDWMAKFVQLTNDDPKSALKWLAEQDETLCSKSVKALLEKRVQAL